MDLTIVISDVLKEQGSGIHSDAGEAIVLIEEGRERERESGGRWREGEEGEKNTRGNCGPG